jgi:hypothetical protein
MKLIEETAKVAHEFKWTVCLYLFARRHVRVYQRIVSAKQICEVGQFYPDAPHWHGVLMQTNRDELGDEGFLALARRIHSWSDSKV